MRKLFLVLLATLSSPIYGQSLPESKAVVKHLTSAGFWGRGYTKDGMARAADYIASEFKSYGIKPMAGTDFKQQFSYPVNTFPGKMELKVNGKQLVPGKDFIIEPSSRGVKGEGIQEEQTDSVTFVARSQRLMLIMQDKLTWGVSDKAEDYTAVLINKKALSASPQTVDINIQNDFLPDFKTSNICGIVRGATYPDSVVMITAHYDHLGGMGDKTYFPGANDNASGISFLLSLAKYYAANPQPFSIGFICFAGEEAGLLGSNYYTENPLFPLSQIKFLINVDMVGTGDKGITVVNATLHPREFSLMNRINDEHHYLSKINSRGKAANSDHYPFSEKGVPAFFIYTQGGIDAYHDVFDRAETLPLTEFTDLFSLFTHFNRALMNK